MTFFDTLGIALINLWRRKLRAILTALGMAIGTTSIVVMISIGLGFSQSFEEQIANFGSLTKIDVGPGWDEQTGRELNIDDDMLMQLSSIAHVETVMPIVSSSGNAKSGRNQSYMEIYGVDFAKAAEFGIVADEGTVPVDKSTGSKLNVLVAGNLAYDMSPPNSNSYYYYDPNNMPEPNVNLMEDRIKFSFDWGAFESGYQYSEGQSRGKTYTLNVTGILDNTTTYEFYNAIFVDLETMDKLLKDNKDFTGYDPKEDSYRTVYLMADDIENVGTIVEEIRAIGLNAWGQGEWIQQSQEQMGMIQAVLGAIGAVAMLVAAIGIMNTMMMSIYERTREIGVIKVLGCKMSNIMRMFLIESGYIGFFGGTLGLLISYGLSYIVNIFAANSGMTMGTDISVIPFYLALGGVAFSAGVAVLSGLYPAIRAMRLSALAAIRNE